MQEIQVNRQFSRLLSANIMKLAEIDELVNAPNYIYGKIKIPCSEKPVDSVAGHGYLA